MLKQLFKGLIYLSVIISASSILAQQNDSIGQVVFLIGDAGKTSNKTVSVFDALLKQAAPISNKSTFLFLGDNIYPGGMPNKEAKGWKEANDIISFQTNLLKKSGVKSYYIPGNHDWNNGKKEGLQHLLNEEKIIEETLGKEAFIPSDACPGPIKINITNNLILIAIDTQWWLHKYDKGICDSISKNDVIKQLNTIIKNNQDKHVLVAGHHPITSEGHHGGHTSFKDHIFPLTSLNKNLIIPLPIIGSIRPLYRKIFGGKQDIPNAKYKELTKALINTFKKYDNIIYAAGHDHNLQYCKINNLHHLISGSGAKSSYVKKATAPNFSSTLNGFFKLSYLFNGNIIIEAFGIVNGSEKLLFKQMITRFETTN